MSEDKEVYCIRVEPFLIDDMWEKCSDFLNNPDIGNKEFCSLDELKENCEDESCQLWILMKQDDLVGCFLTNIGFVSETVKIVNIFHLAGTKIRSWVNEMDRKMVEFCRQNGCKYYSYIGRKGFSRFVPELQATGINYLREV